MPTFLAFGKQFKKNVHFTERQLEVLNHSYSTPVKLQLTDCNMSFTKNEIIVGLLMIILF